MASGRGELDRSPPEASSLLARMALALVHLHDAPD
jgi:hypothetical protein